jgi:hypothetical protein
MWYMQMHIAAHKLGVACIIFHYLKVFVCFIKQACLLACNHFQIGGGAYDSILWLSFAPQKHKPDVVLEKMAFDGMFSSQLMLASLAKGCQFSLECVCALVIGVNIRDGGLGSPAVKSQRLDRSRGCCEAHYPNS